MSTTPPNGPNGAGRLPSLPAASAPDSSSPAGTLRVEASAVGRRQFLAMAGAAGGLATATGLGLARPAVAEETAAPAGPAAAEPLRFAVVTDTHASPEEAARLPQLRRTFESIARANPDFVLNCGDITDYGHQTEYDAYFATIPEELRPKMRHVPGNHDVRWDVNAAQLYREIFGPAPYSFDVGGLHFAGLDPTQLLQEPGAFGPEDLRWLADDLASAAPSVLFLHFPFGADHYYLNDQDAFFETVADLPVRAVFAGHVHREGLYRFNGFTQVTANAVRNTAVYYWVERHDDAGHPVLRVWTVLVTVDGVESRQELTTIPLSGNSSGRTLRPGKIVIQRAYTGTATVRVEVGRDGAPAGVRAQVYPQHVFGGRNAGTWVDLGSAGAPGRGRVWTGTVDVAALPPGLHRMQLRVVGSDGATYESTAPFEKPAVDGTPSERWSVQLGGAVQGALSVDPSVGWSGGAGPEAAGGVRSPGGDRVVFAGSAAGDVVALDAARGRIRWQRSLGPVYRGSAVADGSVYVPSTDHHLYALDAATGADRWAVEVPDPVVCSPLASTVGGQDVVFFSAGETLYAVAAADGSPVWQTDLGGFFAGRVACDGERVYAGSGDGYAYAFDAATGERLWAFNTNTRTTNYTRLLYGAWDDIVELLPGGLVLFATVAAVHAVDVATGVQRWRVASGCMYPPSSMTDHGLLLVDEFGRFQLVDPATGTRRWLVELGHRTMNGGPVVVGDTAWIVATSGLMAGLDVPTGAIGHRLHVDPTNTFSTPVVVDGTLVYGDQAGVVRGITLPA